MADPWELILYHTYAGTPGVIWDQSPSRGSHGVAVNLAVSDFRADGISAGSGAVIFQANSSIRVAQSPSWSPLSGLRGEVVCIREPSTADSTLIDGDSFRFYTRGPHVGAWFSASPHQYAQIDTHLDPVDPNFHLPTGRWMTLGFLHDGVANMELYLDGATVARVRKPLWPINPANSVSIGNSFPPSVAMNGLIDDVKVWRINPHRVDEEFLGRPVDAGVARCRAEWTRALADALNNDRQCAVRLRELLTRAVAGVIRDGLNHSDATRMQWHKAAGSYRQLWSDGHLDDIVPLIADLVSWLQLVGLDPASSPDVRALLTDGCLETILRDVPPLECDPQFTELLTNAARTIEYRANHQRLPTSD
jgi:hypothetical protein